MERQISCIYIAVFPQQGSTLKPLFVLNIFKLVMVNYTLSQIDAQIVEQKLWENSAAAPASRSLHPPLGSPLQLLGSVDSRSILPWRVEETGRCEI